VFLIGHIASLVCSVWLVIGVKTKKLNCIGYWAGCGIVDILFKTVLMFGCGIPLLIIPIAFDIYSIVCVLSLGNQWEAEMDPAELQRQVEEMEDQRRSCGRCEECLVVICCVCEIMKILE
jgi:hypothetical protein